MIRKTLTPLFLIATFFVACKPSKEELKKEFTKGCYEQASKQLTEEKQKTAFKEYCECSGEKVVEKFTVDEIAAFNNEKDKKALAAKLEPVIAGCLAELTKKFAPAEQPTETEKMPADSTDEK